MKQTKIHLLLILSVVLILLLFVSCSEKEPVATTDGTVAETVITKAVMKRGNILSTILRI